MSQTKPLQPWRNRPNPYQGTPGPQGPPGEDGAEWHSVSGAPAGSLGVVGDWALDASTGQVWQKTGTSTWTSRGSLRGPQGVQGETGPAGTITGATATGLAAGASPTVALGGTPSARTFAFGIPKGDKGEKGDTGATGAKGDQGDTGPAGTITGASATTLAPGSVVTVTVGGTPTARTFNFGIPRGNPGPKGDQGEPGGGGVLGGSRGWLSVAQSIPNGTWTTVPRFSGSDQTIGAGGVAWSSSRLQCYVEQGGWWMVGASLGFGAGSSTGGRFLMVETWTGTDPGVGNAANNRIIYQQNNNPSSSAVTFNVSTVVHLEANTNVRLCAYQTSGSSLSTNTAFPTELWLTRIL